MIVLLPVFAALACDARGGADAGPNPYASGGAPMPQAATPQQAVAAAPMPIPPADSAQPTIADAVPASTAGPSGVLTPIDVSADESLVGTTVSVRGYLLAMSQTAILSQEPGSMVSISVTLEDLSTEEKRRVLTQCGTGCTATLRGVLTKAYGTLLMLRVTGIE
jgi:hypothetical protein